MRGTGHLFIILMQTCKELLQIVIVCVGERNPPTLFLPSPSCIFLASVLSGRLEHGQEDLVHREQRTFLFVQLEVIKDTSYLNIVLHQPFASPHVKRN